MNPGERVPCIVRSRQQKLTYALTESGSVIATGANPTVTLSGGSHTVQDKPGGDLTRTLTGNDRR